MRNYTRLDHLREVVAKWRKLPDVNKQSIAMSVIEEVERHEYREILARVGIAFTDSGNLYNDAQRNAEKIFRWLGEMDIAEQPSKLFYVEDIFVSAMPEVIKAEYLNRIYNKAGAYISFPQKSDHEHADITIICPLLIKENSEAQIAVFKLSKGLSLKELKRAESELSESVSITQAALDSVKATIKRLEQDRNAQLKAV
tara:strand:- start:4661 stop:5257 length:597 start_codon:yes stop_codon:yes gene_type:complete